MPWLLPSTSIHQSLFLVIVQERYTFQDRTQRMPRLLSKTNTVQRSCRPGMTPSPSQQQKNRPVPQLSCALCRDRKLKCDKLEPCSNCTSSGVACMPIYRPRLPRGRHARPARSRTSSPPANRRCGDFSDSKAASPAEHAALNAPIDGLESLVQEGEASKVGLDAEGNGLQELVSDSILASI